MITSIVNDRVAVCRWATIHPWSTRAWTSVLLDSRLSLCVSVCLYVCWYVCSTETCESGGAFTMCPVCETCPYWNLSNVCLYAKAVYLFDHPGTVFYAIFTAFWGLYHRMSSSVTGDALGANYPKLIFDPSPLLYIMMWAATVSVGLFWPRKK